MQQTCLEKLAISGDCKLSSLNFLPNIPKRVSDHAESSAQSKPHPNKHPSLDNGNVREQRRVDLNESSTIKKNETKASQAKEQTASTVLPTSSRQNQVSITTLFILCSCNRLGVASSSRHFAPGVDLSPTCPLSLSTIIAISPAAATTTICFIAAAIEPRAAPQHVRVSRPCPHRARRRPHHTAAPHQRQDRTGQDPLAGPTGARFGRRPAAGREAARGRKAAPAGRVPCACPGGSRVGPARIPGPAPAGCGPGPSHERDGGGDGGGGCEGWCGCGGGRAGSQGSNGGRAGTED
jgi:hypothetical protein